MVESMWKDKTFFKGMLGIALPIALQNLITSSLNMVDTLMISSLGDASIAAVGLANQVFFFYMLIVFGINSGSSIFISQFWGKEDIKNIRKILGLAICLGSVVGILFTIAAFFVPEFLMNIFTKDAEVVALGADYLKIVSLSYIVTAIGFSYSVAARSIGQARMPMVVSAISFVTNTFFNYLLIFGKFGFPRLGVKGAAYGTLIARIVELGFILYAVYSDRGVLAASIKDLTGWGKDYFMKYIKTTYPVILNEAIWALGNIMYSIAYARIGKEAIAAVQIATTVQNIFMVISRGLANAATVMVGNKIGGNEEKLAVEYSKRFLTIATMTGVVLGMGLFFSAGTVLKLFRKLTPEVYEIAKNILKVIGIVFFIKMFNGTMIVGVLRGGGDTKFSLFLELGSVWLVGVPMAFLGALVFKLPVHIIVAFVSLEEVVKAVIGIPRLISKKWVKNVTESM
ncbi:MATE family efflux transporter [Anaerosalibacter bizertensis]|uniref:MATE family efflux transporter n=1 Tax=Anaerosalibacter bizertensis TaxID=932217 RepID=A0A844FGN3_9FIRM|nr:MATE family efflux transporter [Anaerosalibacter bizertensis]MSS43112.1 MATE family efflux transporter [Anaerosalibacter bizertensis]